MLQKLADDLHRECCIKGPDLFIQINETNYVKGLYFATKAEAEEHVRNRVTPVLSTMQESKDAELNSYDAIFLSVCILYVYVIAGILNIMVERDAMNHGTRTLPPVLLKNLLNFSRAQLGDLIVAQKFVYWNHSQNMNLLT